MRDLCRLIGWTVVDLIRSRAALEAEIWTLRQQINVLRRAVPKKFSFSAIDRMIFVGLYRLFPRVCDALAIVKPDTLVRWHRAGFRSYWCWKSRCRGGRPIVPLEIRRLLREMSIANPLWGAPRIHGELLKLGIDIGQTSVAKYMATRRGPPSQGWKTFLHNHADGIAAMDLFVVPTISFRLRFSNRPFWVKRFQTMHHCSVDVARGLLLLFGIGTKALPSWDSKTRRNNLLGGLAVSVTVGPSGHANSPHPSSREGHHSTTGWSSSFLLSHVILSCCHATAASRVHWNSVPSTHMRCMITASRRASATIAFFIPRCLAVFMAQALSQDHLLVRVSMTWAAS